MESRGNPLFLFEIAKQAVFPGEYCLFHFFENSARGGRTLAPEFRAANWEHENSGSEAHLQNHL